MVFVCSFKCSPKTMIYSLTCVGLLLFAVIAAAVTPIAHRSATDVSVSVSSAQTPEQRTAFLKSRGYEVDEATVEVREIRVPDQPDAALMQYNELLKTAGWDLEPYMGKRLKLYTYRVLNDADSSAKAYLYVYRDSVVGGHIHTVQGEKALSR